MHREIYVAAASQHQRVRRLRNRLTLVAIGLTALLLLLAAWHALSPGFLPLCATTATGTEPQTMTQRCLGGDTPAPDVVLEVLLLGALGGTLGAAFVLMRARATVASRYDTRTAQIAIKPIVGAATGLLGVLLVQSELLVAPAAVSASALLAYAALFGFAQQLVTRFVDRRADHLLEPAGDDENSETKDAGRA